jgi:hypothetical protein
LTFIESQPATFPVFRGSVEAARSAAGKTVELRGIARNEGDAADTIFRVRVATAFLGWCIKSTQKRVRTVSTPWASDWVVPVSDWAGSGRFSGEWRTFGGRGWFESHLGHVFSLFSGFLASECGHFVL